MTLAFSLAIGLLVLASVADVWTTLVGLRHGLVERNPVYRWARNAPWVLGFLKLVFVVGAVVQFVIAYRAFPGLTVTLVLVSAWLTAFVALRNVRLVEVTRDSDR